MWRERWTALVASFFGVGYIAVVPATWASAVSAVLCWFLPNPWIIGGALLLSAVGLGVCRRSQSVFNSPDPKQFVMDEVCGMMLALLWLPKSVPLYIGAFVLFRVLDVWKPGPVRWIQNSPHPTSIMWDDLAAGVLCNLILQALIRVIP